MNPDDEYVQSQIVKRVRHPLLTILILSICFCMVINNYEPEIKCSSNKINTKNININDDYVIAEESHVISNINTNTNTNLDTNMILSSDCNCNNFFSTLELNINDLKSNLGSLEEVKKTTVERIEEIISHHENLKIMMKGVTQYLDIDMEMDYLNTIKDVDTDTTNTNGITIPRKCDASSLMQDSDFDFDYGEFEMRINEVMDKLTGIETNIKNIGISNSNSDNNNHDTDTDSINNNVDNNNNNNNNNNSQSTCAPSLSDIMEDPVQFEVLTQEVLHRLDVSLPMRSSSDSDDGILFYLEDSIQTNDDTHVETTDSEKITSSIAASNADIKDDDDDNDNDVRVLSDVDDVDIDIDYAQIGAGGRIVKALTSDSFNPSRVWFPRLSHILGRTSGIGLPEVALTPNNHITNCWLMNGDSGSLTVRLSQPIQVYAITIEHISSNDSNIITSTVKDFQLYGHVNSDSSSNDDDSWNQKSRSEFILEGQYSIDDVDNNSQKFLVPDHKMQHLPSFQTIELKILSNHGTKQFTCLHRLRVHGSPSVTTGSVDSDSNSGSNVI